MVTVRQHLPGMPLDVSPVPMVEPVATYRREWARFVDWCHASGLQALPASTVDVLAYLNAEQPTGGTAARWIAGIRAAHHESEQPNPCRGPVTAWVRKRRNPGTTLVDEREQIHKVVQALPVTGWPTGIFGRRDRLAFLLHRIGGIPIRVIAGLRTDQVRLQPQRLRITLDDGDITIDTGSGDPNLCLACAAVRWRWVLAHGPSYTSRDLAARISGEIPLAGHVCDVSDDQPVGPPGWPLFPADQSVGAPAGAAIATLHLLPGSRYRSA